MHLKPYFSVVATPMGLDASFSTTFCCMFSNSRWSGIWHWCSQACQLFSYSIIIYQFFIFWVYDSLFIGKRDVMSLRGFWLIQIGQLIMETGCGSHVHLSFIRYELILNFQYKVIKFCFRGWILNVSLSFCTFIVSDDQYNRIYSPTTFGKKYDPDGDYIRHFLPVLKGNFKFPHFHHL